MKKTTTYFSRIILLLILCGVSSAAWADTWDGTITNNAANKFAENGITLQTPGQPNSAENPYTIDDAKEFAYFMRCVNQQWTGSGSSYYWKLTTDIDLNNITWAPGSNSAKSFQGHFDGDNHTISNLALTVATNSNYGLFPTIQGASATNLAEVKNLNISGVTFTPDASRGGNTRLGALAGYVKQANITNVNVSNVTFTYTNTITGTNQLGGAIGYMENNTTLDNVDVTGVTATFSNTTTGLYVGGIVGASKGNANTNSMTGCDAKTIKVTHNSNITGTTYVGGLVGDANTSLNVINNNTVSGQDGVNGGKAFDVNIAGTATNFYAGTLLAYTTGVGHEVIDNTVSQSYVSVAGTSTTLYVAGLIGYMKCEDTKVNGNSVSTVTTSVATATSATINGTRLAGFIGYIEATGTNKILVKANTVSTINITASGATAGTPYLGGFIGYVKGVASPDKRTLIEGNTVTSPTVTMNGVVGHGFYMGGFLGYADAQTDLFNNKVASPAISITNDVNAETYVGGAVGRQNGYTIIDGMTVTNGSITGPTSDKTVKNNVAFFVGGFIGQQHSSGTAAYQTNKFMNVAVSNMTINLGKYVPGGVINNHKFAVGGIAGCVNAPNKDVNGFVGMPENIIFKGGKIYAPYATTSPTVANFNASNPSHNTMTTEVVTTIDALDKAKVKTWYYSDYELGLSQDFLNSEVVIADNATTAKDKFHKNYTSSATITVSDGISYLTVDNSTFQKSNRFQDSERDSKTVLWWTNTAGYNAAGAAADMFTNEEQPIYPYQAGATAPAATEFPYYWYFFQGVSNANYVASDVADKIIAGIAGNKTQAAEDHPITLTISNDKENERGFAQRTISVVAKTTDNEGNVVDATTGITGYQWYVNGVADGTGTSINLTPHWRDGQGITVNALNGSTVVATATYTLAPGVLKTKAGDSEKVRSDINARGTKDNPYIIDCESALRQWSYLSTAHTATLWEGIIKPVAPFPTNQIAGHYGRAYYELGADITMGSDPFIPISHVGYGSDGTWGTYSNNFSFQGNFDGKGHKISGLKITWGAGQYKGDKTNIYHGLFGAVGHSTATAKWGDGTTTSNTVIQNLVIENATLTHDVNNTTFSYKKSYSHFPTAANENNCMVGVLAGVVAANTTVQNIEIRGSKITDEGSSDYSLATKGLFVGGAIGSVQGAYNNENIPTNTIIKNIVVGTDIDLTHAMIQDVLIAQQGAYNVGGIIGRFASTNGNLANTQAVMPKYLLYTGSIKACYIAASGKKDALISPVIAATRYSNNQSISLTNISKIWEGNNSAAEQLTVTDALYYNFQISDASGDMHLVTDEYPNNVCGNGARAQDTHTDGNETAAGYLAQRYQGVNYNAIFCDAATYGTAPNTDADGGKRMAIAILNSHNDITVYWEWTSGDKTPHMTSTRTEGAYIVRDAETKDKYNVVGTAATAGKYYKWYLDGVEITGDDKHSSSITIPADIGDVVIKAEVYENSSAGTPVATTQNVVIKGEFSVNTSISNSGDTYTVGITRGGIDLTTNNLGGRIAVTYQWYKGNAVNINTAELIRGKTSNSITITKDELGDVNNLFCHVVITTTETTPKELFKGDIAQYVREATVVYLQFNDVKASNGTTYSKSNAGTNTGANDSYGVKQADYANAEYGKTPDKPVKTWAEAYALLNPYTEPTSDNVSTVDTKTYYKKNDGTVTSYEVTYTETKSGTIITNKVYDFSSVPLDEYEFDVYMRDGKKRKVKPIEECTNNWENNIIVLMGYTTDGYFNTGETSQHAVDGARANKPVTITGQWGGTNYYGYLSNSSGDFSINADHKFENMGLGVYDKGIGATESIRYRIYAHRWNVWAGKGLLMGWAAALEWGIEPTDANKKIYKITSADVSTGTPVGQYACDIAIMGGYLNDNTSSNPEMFEYINHGRDDIGQQIKIESGYWGPVCPGNRQTDSGNTINTYYTMGGPDHPAKTTITVDIDRVWNDGTNRNKFNSAMSPATVDIGCLLTGNHEGTMYADVTLNILSAKMGRMVNGIKGAQRRQIKNPGSFTTTVAGVDHYRHIVKYGDTWTEIAAPAPDSYFGRGILNFDPKSSVNNTSTDTEVGINKRVSVIELYCGGLGRGHNDGSYHPEVRSYFYGLCEVNIKGGMFYKTIYGSGAGGTNGIGTAAHHTDDDGIPYWNTDLDVADANGAKHVWYAPYEYIVGNTYMTKALAGTLTDADKPQYNFVKVKVAENNSEDKNLTDDGCVDLEKTRNIINITGGIFGTEKNPVSIYAGGNGETDAALINPSSTKVGDVKNTYNTPNHQAGNMYGAKDGLTTEINISGDAKIYGSIYGGGKGSLRYYRFFLRAPNDVVAYSADNQEYTRIWNPKRSSNGDYNTNGGLDWSNIINSRLNADRYLNLGQIYGNSKVSISGSVEVFGNVYGGGEGVKDVTVDKLFSEADQEFGLVDQLSSKATIIAYEGTSTNKKRTAHVDWANDKFVNFPEMGKIFGSSGVDISGKVIIHGNVYGGGQAGAIEGTTTVNITDDAQIYGKVYGAGQGVLVDEAKNYKQVATIVGNATVNLNKNATLWQDVFGGGQNAVVTGNTYFNMEGGKIAANVYGGGEGDIKKNNAGTAYEYVDGKLVITSADISGDTNVKITGGDIVWDRTSMKDNSASTITIHTYVKRTGGGAGKETYYSTTETNTDAVNEHFSEAGYTNVTVTVGDPASETVDGVTTYKYEVTYNTPVVVVDSWTGTDAEFDALSSDRQTELKGTGYEHTTKTEESRLVKGEIVYWDVEKKYDTIENYKANNDIKEVVEKGIKKKYAYLRFYDDDARTFTIDHNIFGGGYIASNVGGTANVTMTVGLGDPDLMKTTQWKKAFNEYSTPHFYAFGGGYGAYTTVNDTKVDVNVPKYDPEQSAETDEQLGKPFDINFDDDDQTGDAGVFNNQYGIARATVLGVLGGAYAGFVKENTDVTVGGNTFISRVYGGGFGQLQAYNDLVGLVQRDGKQYLAVAGVDYFGSKTREDLGMVDGNTKVTVKGANIYGDVFGGGAGVAPAKAGATTGTYAEITASGTATKNFTMGEVNGYTEVSIKKADGDPSLPLQDDPDRNQMLDDQPLFEASVFGNVYGGGDVADVKGTNAPDQKSTNVDVSGGVVYGDVFGGGKGREISAVYHADANAKTVDIGKVIGNTFVYIYDRTADMSDVEAGRASTIGELLAQPTVYGDIYGGCEFGQIVKTGGDPAKSGNTFVTIDGGFIGNNIFGGGLGQFKAINNLTSADVAGNTNVTINGGSALWNEKSDRNGNVKVWESEDDFLAGDETKMNLFKIAFLADRKDLFQMLMATNAKKVNTEFFDFNTLTYTRDHNIYGGGNEVCAVTGNANVTINHALIDDAENFLKVMPPSEAGICWASSVGNKEHPQYSVFGGGYGPWTTVANTMVAMQCGKNEEVYSQAEAASLNATNNKTPDDDGYIIPGSHKSDFDYTGQAKDREAWMTYFGKLYQDWNSDVVTLEDKDNLYGGNNSAGFWRYCVSQLGVCPGLPRLIQKAVYGGGYAGLVTEDTKVTMSDRSCVRNLYGGGLGSKDYLDKYDVNCGTDAKPNYLYQRLGEVGGNTTVTVSGGLISGEIYGGGAGMESAKLTPEATGLTDFVDMARVKGTTTLTISGSPGASPDMVIDGTAIFGDVFAGGDVANVGKTDDNAISDSNHDSKIDPQDGGYFTSKLIINSGALMGQAFAGGNGRTKEMCSVSVVNKDSKNPVYTYGYPNLGAIYGNTLLDINGYDAASMGGAGFDAGAAATAGITYIFKRVFGGGNNGSVRRRVTSRTDPNNLVYDTNTGNAYVAVKGGYLSYNVFGGGVGTINMPVDPVTGDVTDNNTYSYVEGNTFVDMQGGLALVDQYWDKPTQVTIPTALGGTETIEIGLRQWAALNTDDEGDEKKTYSAQYDPKTRKFLINHNIYAGCRNAGYVNGNTHLKMSRSYIRSGLRAGTYAGVADNFFESQEWKAIYGKPGSPHFCIFGGGFGENTHVMGDTWVDINIDAGTSGHANAGIKSPHKLEANDHNTPAEQRFEGGQSLMDVIGGGYSGDVAGATHVNIENDVYLRRVFGGAFYAPCGQTNVRIKSVNVDNIFGGGMMGDVVKGKNPRLDKADAVDEQNRKYKDDCHGSGAVNVEIGMQVLKDYPSGYPESLMPIADNGKIFINNNVYGGNDVSGQVEGQITINLHGGIIYNNVYGAGNGDYLYALNPALDKVTVHENYEIPGQTPGQDKDNTVYEVPLRPFLINVNDAPSAQKLVNINSYRPLAQFTTINMGGVAGHPVTIGTYDDTEGPDKGKWLSGGDVFGGGNTATLLIVDDNSRPSVTFNIGSYVKAHDVYMGADGDAMFNNTSGFMTKFMKINGFDFSDVIGDLWTKDPAYTSIPQQYLPVSVDNRLKVYASLLDLYFSPVELNVQANLNWCSNPFKATKGDITNTTFNSFFCGGNRGNMNVEPYDPVNHGKTDADKLAYGGNVTAPGQVINYEFPAGLTINEKIVGGCKNSTYPSESNDTKFGDVTHEGGYLLGKIAGDVETNLLVKCAFERAVGVGEFVEGRNVYGGCYSSGVTKGDISIDFRSKMLSGYDDAAVKKIRDDGLAIANIYGAGYRNTTWVYGNTDITFGKGCKNTIDDSGNVTEYGCTANYIYGGGQEGNIVGSSTIHVLNGHLASSAVGGSYSGMMWGSTQVLVGYPKYYKVLHSAKYMLKRADKWNSTEEYKRTKDQVEPFKGYRHHDDSEVIKPYIYLMEGDIVSEQIWQSINDYTDATHAVGAQLTYLDREENEQQCFEHVDGLNPYTGCLKDVDDAITDVATAWNNIRIKIDEAAYGGGYSLTTDLSGGEAYTVRRFEAIRNLNDELTSEEITNMSKDAGITDGSTPGSIGYGGNTTVLVWDNNSSAQTIDHIDISSQAWTEVTLDEGADLFGYYRNVDTGGAKQYAYTYEEGKYFYTNNPSAVDATHFKDVVMSSSEGGLFGDGHLSFAQGFRNGEIHGYGFATGTPEDAKVINTLQRFDIMRIEDCAMVLLGARDYTVGEISTTPFSLARMGELQMIATNVTGKNSGNLAAASALHSRNYLGLSSDIHYVGAINSNVDFNDNYHYGNKNASDNGKEEKNMSYREYKQGYITNNITNESVFQERNDGTAANMIGISSGYALKLQNVYTTVDKDHEDIFYGPIIGVIEMNLINVKEDEGGGYVYADNIHHRKSTSGGGGGSSKPAKTSTGPRPSNVDDVPTHADADADEDFLETSGNFVFPYNEQLHRYIVDDCFTVGYDESRDREHGNHATEPIHYWYVTGYNYYFNAHITGYTFDTENSEMKFKSDNDDGLLVLSGMKKGQLVNLQSMTWRSNHSVTDGFVACDLETHTGMATGQKGNLISNYFKIGDDGSFVTTDADDTKKLDGMVQYNHYNLFMSAGSVEYDAKEAYWPYLPLGGEGIKKNDTGNSRWLTNCLTKDDAPLAFLLTDKVDNSGQDYYNKYMKQPCQSTLVFTAPAVKVAKHKASQVDVDAGRATAEDVAKENLINDYRPAVETDVAAGYITQAQWDKAQTDHQTIYIDDYKNIKGYISATEFYTKDEHEATADDVTTGLAANVGDKVIIYNKLTAGTSLTSGTTYYYLGSEDIYHEFTYYKSTDEDLHADPKKENMLYTYNTEHHAYISVNGLAAGTISSSEYNKLTDDMKKFYTASLDGTTYSCPAIPAVTPKSGEIVDDKPVTYYIFDKRYFCYTVYLTIDYVQGPSYKGQINIRNCALPGEQITIDRGSFELTSDQAFAMSGASWRFGPAEEKGGKLVLKEGKYLTYEVEKPYGYGGDAPTSTSEIFNRSLDGANSSINLPAYFFMNGYYVQYVFRVNNMETEFAVDIKPDDRLLIHNYHRMQPIKDSGLPYAPNELELYIDKAARRAYDDAAAVSAGNMQPADALPEPRMYIENNVDMKRFSEFLNEVTTKEPDVIGGPKAREVGSHYNFGKNIQFFIQNDLNLATAEYVAPQNFHGTLNGDGHLISGVDYLFLKDNKDKNHGQVHNLGMLQGKITEDDGQADKSRYHCCYTYADNTVYRIDGKAVTTYSEDDWRLGKVAYDLNQYYLEKRKSNNDGQQIYNYVENLYTNGDYLYARMQGVKAAEFLRSNEGVHYDNPDSWHYFEKVHPAGYPTAKDVGGEMRHAIDAPRAVDYIAAVDASTPESFAGTYQPLIDEAHVEGTKSDAKTLRNDYIFFGQRIMPTAAADNGGLYPRTFATNTSTDMTHNANAVNRVMRAYGFHGNKQDRAYHFNPEAWVQETDITAIDFTGAHDGNGYGWNRGAWNGSVAVDDYPKNSAAIFYPLVLDLPVPLTSYNSIDAVSRNILVYTDAKADGIAKSYDAVNDKLSYGKDKSESESSIKGHQIVQREHVDGKPDYAAELLHLVERTSTTGSDGYVDSEGGTCLNNDFNCPIPFDVTDRAWYVRKPANYGGGNDSEYLTNDAWEGLALPFAVNCVTSRGGDYEMTHFYGNGEKDKAANDGDDDDTAPDNLNTVGHEYWLRGLVSVTTEGDETKGSFMRPAVSGTGLFVMDGALSGQYNYECTYLRETYYKYTGADGNLVDDDSNVFFNNDIYNATRSYTEYVPQNADIPYIVRFPGERYKEFDLSGMYNGYLQGSAHNNNAVPDSHSWSTLSPLPQNVTFSWYSVNSNGSGSRTIDDMAGAYTIKVTDDQTKMTTTVGTYRHAAAYKAIDSSDSNPIYGINATGTAFNADVTSVLPFRTYMTTAATPQHAPSYIIIGGTRGFDNPSDPQTGEDLSKRMVVYSVNHNIIIESTYKADLLIYSSAGQLIRAVHVDEGSNLYTGFPSGIYIIAGHKIVVK